MGERERRERERERLIGNNTRPAKQVVEVEAVVGAVWVGNAWYGSIADWCLD